VQKLFPRMLPDGIAKQRVIVAAAEPVSAAILLVCPTAREIGKAHDLVIDDCLIANSRTEDPVSTALQTIDDPLQTVRLDHKLGTGRVYYCLLRRIPPLLCDLFSSKSALR
jgi:hypothetical protein